MIETDKDILLLLHYVYKLFFLCELVGGSPSASIETEEVGFFEEDNIPNYLSDASHQGKLRDFFNITAIQIYRRISIECQK
jgi:hypothetical protein